MQVRFDRGELQRPIRRDGVLVIEGYAARVHRPGDGLRYSWGQEYRDATELKRILGQLEGLPVTLGHPPDLLRNGAKGRVVGRVDAAWLDGDRAAVRVSVWDALAAKWIEEGIKELSLGYGVRVDDDGHQRDSDSDHLAIVDRARCGDACSLRTDGETACACGCSAQIDRFGLRSDTGSNSRGINMDKDEQIRLLQAKLAEANKLAETAQADLKTRTDAHDALKARAETAEGTVKQLQARLDSGAEAVETEALKKKQTRIDELESEKRDLIGNLPVRVRARATLVNRAQTILGNEARLDGLDDRAIWEAGIRRFEPTAQISKETTDAYLKARFDSLYEQRSDAAMSTARLGAALAVRKDDRINEVDPFDPLTNGAGQYASPHAAKRGA